MRHDVQFIEPTGTTVDGLLSDFRWVFTADAPRVLHYHFADDSSDFFIDSRFGYTSGDTRWDLPFRAGFSPLDLTQQGLARDALALFEDIINVSFVATSDPLQADIRFAITDLAPEGVSGQTYLPYSAVLPFDTGTQELYEAAEISGDIWLDNNVSNPQLATALLREIGQALGMSEGDENGFEFIEDVVSATLPAELDSPRYSALSDPVAGGRTAATPMSLDIDALQYLYGAASNTSNDLYIIKTSVDSPTDPITFWYADYEVHEFVDSYISIVDDGGDNVLYIDLEEDVVVDMEAGSWSVAGSGPQQPTAVEGAPGSVLAAEPNLYLAPATVLHDLTTLGGDDIISANNLGNVIWSGAGDDVIHGGAGDDVIRLGVGADSYTWSAGNDMIDGNNGRDTIDFGTDSYGQYKFTQRSDGLLITDIITGDASQVRNVEVLAFGDDLFDPALVSRQIVDLNRDILLSDIRPLSRSDIGTDESSVSALEAGLYRVYFGGLGRVPDREGFDWWLNEIETNGASFASVATGFVNSEEFIGLADSNANSLVSAEEFVTHMYSNVFGRAPDEEGFNWWLEQLYSQQHTYGSAFASMVQSDEFVQLTAATVYDYVFI